MESDPVESGKVYWCPTCDVPLLSVVGEEPKCDICESRKSNPRYAASDLRPVFDRERDLLLRELGIEIPLNVWYDRRRILYRGNTLFAFTVVNNAIALRRRNPENNPCASDLETDGDQHLAKTVAANTRILRRMEREALAYIQEAAKTYPKRRPFVSFSGGKDSTVVAFLARQALGAIPLFFGDTTLEYEDTTRYIYEFAREYEFPLESRASQNDFFEMSERLGPPSRIMRWCCTVFKAYPINLFWNSLEECVLVFDGMRRAESRSRSTYPREFRSKKYVRQLAARPILYWSTLATWLYVYYRELPLNPVYRRGHSRVGCVPCPYNTNYDDLLKQRFREPLWNQWVAFLEKYARERNRPNPVEWVLDGHWKKRMPGKTTSYVVSRDRTFSDDRALAYTFPGGIPTGLPQFLKPIAPIRSSATTGAFRSCHASDTRIAGAVGGKLLIVVRPPDMPEREFRRLVKVQIEKSLNCVGCGGCVGACPHGAISVNHASIVIDEERCQHCLSCITSDLTGSGHSCVALSYKGHRDRVLRHAS